MMKFFTVFLLCAASIQAIAQDKWDLRRCVEYATEHNISVKQADVQSRIALLQTKLSKAQQYPNISFNTQAGFNFGRSIDPTSNQYTTQQIFFSELRITGRRYFILIFFNLKK